MDETLSADEFAAFWIKENDDWMTTDEAIVEMALMDTDSRGNVTFDQVLTFIKEQSQIEEAWSTFWQTLDTTWSYQLNQTTTEEAWASIDITTYSNWTLSSDDAISWFTRMDLDQNGIVEKREACAVANGRMCNNWFNQNTEYLEWPADKNFDGYVSESEYSRYMNGTNASINTVMYNDWLMSGLDAGVELSWNTIQQRQSLVNETFTSWANLVDQEWLANGNVTEYSSYAANSSSFYNSTEPTKIPVDTMVNTYSYTTASDWDLDQDLMISDKEFCIGTIGNELPCMDQIDLDIKYWADTDADDQVSWDEYWTIAQQEGDAENSAQLDFDLYDMNNDGFVVRDEIDEYETYMNDAMNSTTSFNTTEFGNVTALFDQDGDMALNRAEFNEAVNMVLLFTDNAQLDATTEETFFNAAAANKDAMDSIDATIFLRKILGTGLKAYIDEL